MSDAASPWSPAQYEKFKAERAKPLFDLLAMVRPRDGMRVVDLGCGTGEGTREVHRKLAARATLGVDESETMLAKAATFAGEGLRFQRARIEGFAPEEPLDLVFSNAALQWVDGHPALLARLAAMLAPGGQIAVQMPSNDDHPSHVVAGQVAAEAPFRDALGGYTRVFPNLGVSDYATALDALGFREQDVRLQVYAHHLGARDDVVEWVKGTLLTDYQKRMPADMWPAFLARYRAVLLPTLVDAKPYFYPFKRILFWAQR